MYRVVTFLMYKLVEELIILGVTALLMCTRGAGVFCLIVGVPVLCVLEEWRADFSLARPAHSS